MNHVQYFLRGNDSGQHRQCRRQARLQRSQLSDVRRHTSHASSAMAGSRAAYSRPGRHPSSLKGPQSVCPETWQGAVLNQ